MIQTKDISFVVQGAIDRTISPLTGEPMTRSCLASLRKYHPGAELILSTWPDQDLSGLDYDVLVINEDPGAWNAFHPDCGVVKLDNTNRQIVSTKNGLRKAGRPYAAKIRSDMVFSGNGWMRYLDRYPRRIEAWKIFRERVITCSMFARDPRCPYSRQALHPPDWVYIGLTEDIRLLWDIDIQPEPESSQWFLNRPIPSPYNLDVDLRRYSPEQYLWRTLLAKFGTVRLESRGDLCDENIAATEISFANNLIILDVDQFPFTVHRYPVPLSAWYSFYRFLSHREWEWLYYRHCGSAPTRAALARMCSPHYYLKRAYFAWHRPWQTVKRLRGLPNVLSSPVGPQRA
jgi:hypothetical protein